MSFPNLNTAFQIGSSRDKIEGGVYSSRWRWDSIQTLQNFKLKAAWADPFSFGILMILIYFHHLHLKKTRIAILKILSQPMWKTLPITIFKPEAMSPIFVSLPSELILCISEFLLPPDLICFSLCNHRLYMLLLSQRRRSYLSERERLLILQRLNNDDRLEYFACDICNNFHQ